MDRSCRLALYGFLGLNLAALALLVVGTFGLFGLERDPLSGVLLVLLGLPWSAHSAGAPEALWPWIALGAPLVALLLIRMACGWLSRRRTASGPGS